MPPGCSGQLGVARDADLTVDARIDRRRGIAAEALARSGCLSTWGRSSPASGSPVAPGVPVLVTLAFPLLLTPPTTWTPAAVTLALPLAGMALDELESTTTLPGTLMAAFPDRLRAPPAVAVQNVDRPGGGGDRQRAVDVGDGVVAQTVAGRRDWARWSRYPPSPMPAHRCWSRSRR